jgi:hypothetical protein
MIGIQTTDQAVTQAYVLELRTMWVVKRCSGSGFPRMSTPSVCQSSAPAGR